MAASEKRLSTWATAPKTISPATAPMTPATRNQPAAEARTEVGNSSLSSDPMAGAKTDPAKTLSRYPTMSAAGAPA